MVKVKSVILALSAVVTFASQVQAMNVLSQCLSPVSFMFIFITLLLLF